MRLRAPAIESEHAQSRGRCHEFLLIFLAVFNLRLAALRGLFTVVAARVSVADVQPAALCADNMIIQRATQAPV